MAFKNRIVFGIVITSVVFFVIGILVGHFGIKKSSVDDGSKAVKNSPESKNSVEKMSVINTCNTDGLPRTYLAYHLNNLTINIDGKLDDVAWQEVPWTEAFVDIRGTANPPRFETKVKVRWDDQRLYVGARMAENQFWGTFTVDESEVWRENAFEVYVVPDGSLHNYKEMQISVMNVSWDLMLRKAYIDANKCEPRNNVRDGTFWSVEWSFSFKRLAENTNRSLQQEAPVSDEAWFFIFARPEYQVKIENNTYVKDESQRTDWWSWQPMYTVNLHLPSRFGLVQFKRNLNEKSFDFKLWHIYKALFEVFEAEHKYHSINDMYIEDLKQLDIAPKYRDSKCVHITIKVPPDSSDFDVSVHSRMNSTLKMGHIRADRFVWFA